MLRQVNKEKMFFEKVDCALCYLGLDPEREEKNVWGETLVEKLVEI